jgi:hypothetical protein
MKINVFEGARRILRLLQAVWVLGAIVVSWNQTPYVSLTYSTAAPSAPFVPAEDCRSNDRTEHLYGRKLDGEKTASVTLCFTAQEFPNGSMLIPYTEKDGQVWGNGEYSNEVMNYTKARAERFDLPDEGRKRALEQWNRRRTDQLKEAALFTIGGVVCLSILSAIIGWIVRGFFGIPRGQDRRPEPTEPKQNAVGA